MKIYFKIPGGGEFLYEKPPRKPLTDDQRETLMMCLIPGFLVLPLLAMILVGG